MGDSRQDETLSGRDGCIEELRLRLAEAEETLRAIRQGEVDALMVEGPAGPQVYTLQNADRPYRIIVERMQEGALTLSAEGTVLYGNQSLARMLRLPIEGILGETFERFVAEDSRAQLGRLLEASGRAEIELRRADGALFPVHVSTAELEDEQQRMISAIVTDLTQARLRTRELADANAKLVAAMAEREHAENLLRQSQKMEAVGQLTAGIAHDFNNLLTVIAGNLELIQSRAEDRRLKHQVETIQRALHRGARLTDQLLAFSHQRMLRPRAVSIKALLSETEPLLARAVGDEVTVRLKLDEDVGHCLIDPTELQASMLNLAINARDAMPEGGSLTIAAKRVARIAGAADDAPPGGYVMIAVADSGQGMTAEVRDRAFDPFYTTKQVGKGTGLGLSQVYGFIRQSGGHVSIESDVGAGTTVRLYLPASEAADPDEAESETRAGGGAVERRSVLVVEDDEDVRQFMTDLLGDLGYDILEAESGPAALRLLEEGAAVDLVFSDVRMPHGMSGFQLAKEIRRRLPEIAILLTSGMAPLIADQAGDWHLLRKPFGRDELAQAIADALDAQKATA
jgi:PAS domain S-box-containing protein